MKPSKREALRQAILALQDKRDNLTERAKLCGWGQEMDNCIAVLRDIIREEQTK